MATTMSSTKSNRAPNTGRRPLLSGLLLGLLLTIFITTFAYVAYLFLAWGQTAWRKPRTWRLCLCPGW